MVIESLTLSGFRNYTKQKKIEFSALCTIIVGPNAVGKTNLLEALYAALTGNGFREKKVDELIGWELTDAKIKVVLQEKKELTQLELHLQRKNEVISKFFFINGLRKTLSEYRARSIPVVLFQPNDLTIITGTPDKRRTLIDIILCRTSQHYSHAKTQYERALYKRNKLLEFWRHKSKLELDALLTPWDSLLVSTGAVLQTVRTELVNTFNSHPEFDGMSFQINYVMNSVTHDLLLQSREHELRIGRTCNGPQLDDFILLAKHDNPSYRELARFGARSEQRMGMLWLKINEMRYLEKEVGNKPILLMDDIFSELDYENSEKIGMLTKSYQTVITTSHKDVISQLKSPFDVIEL